MSFSDEDQRQTPVVGLKTKDMPFHQFSLTKCGMTLETTSYAYLRRLLNMEKQHKEGSVQKKEHHRLIAGFPDELPTN
ncbi:hypothetical protein KIN20_036155 [Parelaphostrongylus tenuis]|uniref:Uncharacterized protein n=1 Tax=Parelaphostrongylus tenuis TaxID=148309 RepID=A0AAD5WK81_PARTN|nr:hypothetical protein KIN20_036155 [Parelaphostrongylus tenuis]